MRFIENRYTLLGLGLALTGALLAPLAYLILRSTPLTALGMSTIILGAVCLALGRARPKIPPELSAILLQAGLDNISAILEELGLRSKAIYLPSSVTGGYPRALIPMDSNSSPLEIKRSLPKRLIAKYGPRPEDIGILITTPGSTSLSLLESKPGPTPEALEAALSSILVGTIDLADAVKVSMSDEGATIEVSNPHIEYESTRLYQLLGSPVASIVASLTAEALDKPVTVDQERYDRGKSVIEIKVVQ